MEVIKKRIRVSWMEVAVIENQSRIGHESDVNQEGFVRGKLSKRFLKVLSFRLSA